MKLSEKLIALRKEKGWSQEDFAEKLDVSRQAISRWENGSALPDAQNILRISKLFDVSADYLLNDDYNSARDITAAETLMEETASLVQKKKIPYWCLIPAGCFLILAACLIINVVKNSDEAPHHHTLSSVKENEVAPSCTAEGSYDEVVYCTECNEELLRTHRSTNQIGHTPSDSVKENEVAPTCAAEGSYDEVVYCTDCNEEILRMHRVTGMTAHTLSGSVKENEVAPTCAEEGSYDEVIYCTRCRGEILRTKKGVEKLEHQFQDRKCLACGEAQPSEGLVYMSNGNGTCAVDIGDCTDENIVIPSYSPDGDRVIQIKAYAFSGRNNIKSVQIPETVTRIGEGAFEDCVNLESVNLPKKLTMILSYTFDGCKNLKEITIPSGVTYIGDEAFADCVSMERITIPAGVTRIGRFAFRNFSRCEGTVTFEVYEGWGLYDDSGSLVHMVDFANGHFSPCEYITFAYSEYSWRRN